jgi:hypothetical protein
VNDLRLTTGQFTVGSIVVAVAENRQHVRGLAVDGDGYGSGSGSGYGYGSGG